MPILRASRAVRSTDVAGLRVAPNVLRSAGMFGSARRSQRVGCAMPVYWSRRRTPMSGQAIHCNAHGLFIATLYDADVGFVLDFTIVLPTGAISATGIARFVGFTPAGRGLGIELHVMDTGDRQCWHTHYVRTLRAA